MTVKCLDDQEKADLCYWYRFKDDTISSFAKFHKVSRRTIIRVLQEKGVPIRKEKRVLTIRTEEEKIAFLLKKHKLNYNTLKVILEHHSKVNPKVQPLLTKAQQPLF